MKTRLLIALTCLCLAAAPAARAVRSQPPSAAKFAAFWAQFQSAVTKNDKEAVAALTAARHCQQVLAGIGFTAEHPFHRYYRRILLLDQLFGSAHGLTRDFGEELLQSRQLPALLPL